MPELPLLRRELLGILRTRRAFWLLVLTVTVSTILPLSFWPVQYARGAAIPTAAFYLLFFWTLLTSGLIVATSFAAASIAGEREQGTYELLCSLPLSPLVAVLPKLTACTAYASLILLTTAPAAMSFYFLGGIGLDTILSVYCVLLAALVTAVPIGVTASLQSATTAEASLRGIAYVAFWCSGPLLLLLLPIAAVGQLRSIRRFGLAVELSIKGFLSAVFGRLWAILAVAVVLIELCRGHGRGCVEALVSSSPFWVVHSVVESRADDESLLAWYFGCAALVGLSHLFHCALSVRRGGSVLRYDPNPRRFFTRISEWASHADHERSFLTEVLIDWASSGTRFLDNPVFVREARTELHGSRRFHRWLFSLPFLAYLLFGYSIAYSNGWAWLPTVFVPVTALILLMLPALAGVAISSEAERGNLETLKATPLTPQEVLKGKWLASLAAVGGLPAVVFWLVGFALPIFLGDKSDPTPLAVLIARVLFGGLIFAVTTAFAGVASLYASIRAGRSLPALLLAYLLVLGPTALIPGYLAMVLPSSAYPMWLSPFTAEVSCLTGRPFEIRWADATIFCGLYVAVATILWKLAVRRLERWTP